VTPPPVYLDNNATTRVDPAVVAAMLPFLTEQFGNASSLHGFGAAAARALANARRQLQGLLGAAAPDEIVFTASGTEADATALLSALETQEGRDEIVTSAVEHPAVLALCQWLHKRRDVRLHVVPVDRLGRLDLDAYRAALGPRTAIASIMWANNETGTLFPVAHLAELAHAAGALFHTDAVQAVGKLEIDLAGSDIDLLSLSGHKLHAPKGVGALYVRRGVRLQPLLRGGRQERGRRASTENIPGIVALGHAADLARTRLAEVVPHMRRLRDWLEQELLRLAPDAAVIGDPAARLPNTLCIGFDGVEGEAVLTLLDRAGIAASSGAACHAGGTEPSHVLRAMRVHYPIAQGAVRFSLSRETTEADIARVTAVLPGILARLRARAPTPPLAVLHA